MPGGIFSGITLYLSWLYPRNRLALRMNTFVSLGAALAAFSGIIAYGITKMDTLSKLAGWSWIFVIEGLFTVVFGVLSFWLLPGDVSKARTFGDQEKRNIGNASNEDVPEDRKQSNKPLREVALMFKSVHVWLGGVMSFTAGVKLYGTSFFLQMIVTQLGYSTAKSELMIIPPYVAGLVVAVAVGYFSDRFVCRGLSVGLCSLLGLVGFALLLGSASNPVRYGSVVLAISGSLPAIGIITTWISNNAFSRMEKATALGFSGMMAGSASIMSVWVFGKLPEESTAIILLAFTAAEGILAIFNMMWLRRKNEQAEAHRSRNTHDKGPVMFYIL
ncbi:hypothetical protein V5O48_001456 [Marasmius crinis-equi]|uniref:Major facilitator superfamily (MFS) profile domain-containing protein n=1 Tax=Marasmius crinis-equi TaxID=585013 RepID=A0ABR3FYL5_9AGAR